MNQGLKNLLLILGMGVLPVSLFAADLAQESYRDCITLTVGPIAGLLIDNADIKKVKDNSQKSFEKMMQSFAEARIFGHNRMKRIKKIKSRVLSKSKARIEEKQIENFFDIEPLSRLIKDGAVDNIEVAINQSTVKIATHDKKTNNSLLHVATEANQHDIALILLCNGFKALDVNNAGKKPSDLTTDKYIKRVLLEAEMYEEQELEKHDQMYDEMLSSVERAIFKQRKKKNKKDTVAQAGVIQEEDIAADDHKQAADAGAQAAQKPHSAGAAAAAGAGAEAQNQAGWHVVASKIKLSAHAKQINGRWYTKHALERMAPNTEEIRKRLSARALAMGYPKDSDHYKRYIDPRAVTSAQIEETIKCGSKRQYEKNTIYHHNDITVVLGADQAVVTVIRTS